MSLSRGTSQLRALSICSSVFRWHACSWIILAFLREGLCRECWRSADCPQLCMWSTRTRRRELYLPTPLHGVEWLLAWQWWMYGYHRFLGLIIPLLQQILSDYQSKCRCHNSRLHTEADIRRSRKEMFGPLNFFSCSRQRHVRDCAKYSATPFSCNMIVCWRPSTLDTIIFA